MTDNPHPAGTSPDPFERFPVYDPGYQPQPSDPPPVGQPTRLPARATPPSIHPVTHLAPAGSFPVSDESPPSTALLVVSWVVVLATGFYMLPWAIAVTRGKSNQWAIFAGNLLLGWTFVGWIVALVKSCGAHRLIYPAQQYLAIAAAPAAAAAPPGWYPLPDGSGTGYWDGQSWTGATRR